MIKSQDQQNKTILKRTGQVSLIILIVSVFGLLIHGSNSWCNYIELFDVVNIQTTGNRILSDQDIFQIANVRIDTSINSINLSEIQDRLEENPFIKAAAVSREFPNTLNILISERVPICYINHSNLFLIDAEGIILPLPGKPLGINLPVISGFEHDSLIYYPGYYVPNKHVLDVVNIIHSTLLSTPNLYSEISEIHCWKDGSCILYTIKSGTPIFLGTRDLSDQLNILAHFQNRLQGKRNLSDYQYLDLRWAKQIVARERRS